MKKLILTFSFLVLLFGTLQASVSIIPMPQKCIEKRGNFTVNDKTVITLSVDNEEMRNAVSFGMICLIQLPGSHWRSLLFPVLPM